MTSSDKAPVDSIKAIVVLGSTVTALAIVREAHQTGRQVHVVDTLAGIAMKSRYPRKVLLSGGDDVQILSELQALAGIDTALVADSDRWLRFILRQHSVLKGMFGAILHPDPKALGICLHKVNFLKWCRDNNIPAPKLYEVCSASDLDALVEYPVIVRPEETRHGDRSGLPKAVEVRNADELRDWLLLFEKHAVRPVVCESALSTGVRQYSVGLARHQGRVISFVAEKIRPLAARCSGGCYVVGSSNLAVQMLAESTLDLLDFQGIAEVEILCDTKQGKHWVIEVNARPWVQFPLPAKAGCKLLSFALGEPLVDTSGLSADKRWLWFATDFYECFSAADGLVSTGQMSFRNYLLSVLQANAHAFWNPGDPWPFCYEFSRFLSIAGRSIFRKTFQKGNVKNYAV